MNKKILIVLISIIVISSCNSIKLGSKNNFMKYYSKAIKNNLIENDPLILIDGKSIGLLSEIDYETPELKTINKNSLTVIPKGSEYLKKFWGENAENGIIEISKYMTLHCAEPPKKILLLDDKEVTWEQLGNLKSKSIIYASAIDDIVYKGEFIEILILITNKP